MKVNSPILFIKFNIKEIFIFVGKENDNGSIDLLEMVTLPTENFYENRSYNFLKNSDLIKKNILYINLNSKEFYVAEPENGWKEEKRFFNKVRNTKRKRYLN